MRLETERRAQIQLSPLLLFVNSCATDGAGQQKIEKQGLQPLTEPSIHVKELIKLVMDGATDESDVNI